MSQAVSLAGKKQPLVTMHWARKPHACVHTYRELSVFGAGWLKTFYCSNLFRLVYHFESKMKKIGYISSLE